MKNIIKKMLYILGITAVMLTMNSCVRPYDTPEFKNIEASQTAFLIPLVGDTTEQASFQSEELLAKAMIATKEVQIPHRWVQTGRWDWVGEWKPAAKLIVVDRTPVTREWSMTDETGTSKQNQAIYAEDIDSIGFSVGMNCSAQIYTEADAVKFLYSYNNIPLSDIIDTEIRAMVETEYVERAGKLTMAEINRTKDEIITAVRNEVTAYFADKGITITVLGYKEGIEYEDAKIQNAINEKFISAQLLEAQENTNEATLSKANAEAEAVIIAARAEAEANKLLSESITPELIEMQKYNKWNGELPTVSGTGSTIIDMTK